MEGHKVHVMRQFFRRLLGRGWTGPVHPVERRLMLDLAHLRNRITAHDDPGIRAFLGYALSNSALSSSQIFQDLFVLYVLGEKRNGYFCEFGSTDGVHLSNSHCLERHFGWKGICAEPARSWHAALRANRPNAFIETGCVWSRTGESLSFSEARTRELSTISAYRASDGHSGKRRDVETYEVETISLDDLLSKYGAPADFDYLSMDTEGSELAILESFDLTRWRPKIVTIEHNYTPSRDAIHALMTAAGYRRVLEEASVFDDWYLAPGVELPAA